MDEGDARPLTCSLPVIQTLYSTVESSFLPEITAGSERPLLPKDFSSYLANIERRFPSIAAQTALCISNRTFTNDNTPKKLKTNVIVSTIVLCGQHSKSSLWTTDQTLSLSRSILSDLINAVGYDQLEKLLSDERNGYLKLVFNKIRPWLQSSNWKHYPAAVNCYSWILHKVQRPQMCEYLDSVLPTALIITDDFVNQNRIIGLNCLEHIINNVSRSELTRCCHDQVIYKAVEPILYQRDADIVPAVMSCITSLLSTIHPPQDLFSTSLQWNSFDDVLTLLLENMYLEQNCRLRGCYIDALTPLLQAMGLSSVRHLAQLRRILDEYLLEPTTSLQALQAVNSLLEVGWPRLSEDTTSSRWLLVALLKLLRDSTVSGTELGGSGGNNRSAIAEAATATVSNLVRLLPPCIVSELREEAPRLFTVGSTFRDRVQAILQHPADILVEDSGSAVE